MDNQHKQINGCRDLSEEEIYLINEAKSLAVQVGDLVAKIQATPLTDKRWISIGQTDLQKGFMSLIRAVAQPITF